MDELDITSAEAKATYQEIKDYMLKEFGLKVSTLFEGYLSFDHQSSIFSKVVDNFGSFPLWKPPGGG